ncbi:hypothetical protein LMG29739_03905 [Paraburkholderia solisilvae]|uniref:Uncharacterized protein n=1 Tax=Paraburkholderia solisilvae TaxID=624376 RepID=A0A6J5EBM4_9BURK|nr:hypothetical protein LMG29739_03905 [Paraburkholderia solisilvae]
MRAARTAVGQSGALRSRSGSMCEALNATDARFPGNAYLRSAWTANVHHVHDSPREATQLGSQPEINNKLGGNLGTGKRTMRSELKNDAEGKLQRTSVRG